jgi:hypothetical protein
MGQLPAHAPVQHLFRHEPKSVTKKGVSYTATKVGSGRLQPPAASGRPCCLPTSYGCITSVITTEAPPGRTHGCGHTTIALQQNKHRAAAALCSDSHTCGFSTILWRWGQGSAPAHLCEGRAQPFTSAPRCVAHGRRAPRPARDPRKKASGGTACVRRAWGRLGPVPQPPRCHQTHTPAAASPAAAPQTSPTASPYLVRPAGGALSCAAAWCRACRPWRWRARQEGVMSARGTARCRQGGGAAWCWASALRKH